MNFLSNFPVAYINGFFDCNKQRSGSHEVFHGSYCGSLTKQVDFCQGLETL
jgi:hypothetical protein